MTESPTPPSAAELVNAMVQATPFAAALGFMLVDIAPARVRMKAPYRADVIGDPETGVIAGGVITALLDHACGAAAMVALPVRNGVATLDLRLDYMRPAIPQRDIIAEAHCYKVTRSVAFVRAVAFEDDPEDPVANATAAFMIADGQGRPPGSNRRPK
jgi:uncharacterized protein (TIGR00369 family)